MHFERVRGKRKFFRQIWTGLSFYHQRVNAQVASRVTKRLKGKISGLRRFIASEFPIKIMKNGLYFTLKAIFSS